jgi:hypothetical protein
MNCFPFEEMNRNVTKKIKGQDLVGDEFLKLWGVHKNLFLFAQNLDDDHNIFLEFI